MTKSQLKLFVCIRSASGFNTWLISIDLQQKRHKSDIHWNRVIDSQKSHISVSLPSASSASDRIASGATNTPQVPKIRTTSAEEDLLSEHAPSCEAVQHCSVETQKWPRTSNRPKASTFTSSRSSSQKIPDVSRSITGPRRFHFLKNSSLKSSHALGSFNVLQKHKKARRTDLPVFIEKAKFKFRPKNPLEFQAKFGDETSKEYDDSSPVSQLFEQRPRKRPIASPAEQKWRTENWSKSTKADHDTKGKSKTAQSIDKPSSQWDYNSEELVGQLQQVVLQEMISATAGLKDNEIVPQSKVKVQPQPPKPRQPSVKHHPASSSEDESIIDVINHEDNDDYVYDTYVRSVGQPAGVSVESSGGDLGRFQSIDHSKIGILVIAEEDQEEWETFAEADQDSDKDWNSEEEDENGAFIY